MTNPQEQFHLNTIIDAFPSEVVINFVTIRIDTLVHIYIRDRTRLRTLNEIHQTLQPRLAVFDLVSTDIQQIYETLRHQGLNHRESEFLTSNIGPMVTNNQFGIQIFDIELLVTLTYERIDRLTFNFLASIEENDVVDRLVRQSALVRECAIDEETLRSLGLESASCSICFDNILGTFDQVPTRMSCSHVFHDRCILQWLRRRNSCPLCRQILYRP